MQAGKIFPNNHFSNSTKNQEKWVENIEEAEKHLKIADHMAYVTLTILKENRMIIKILEELYSCATCLMKGLLQYEYALKRVPLYKNPELNLKTFKNKISPRYFNESELKIMLAILEIQKKHKESPVEFVRRDKFVILLGDQYIVLTVEKIREFLGVLKRAIISTKDKMIEN